jgi:hypothetical protein
MQKPRRANMAFLPPASARGFAQDISRQGGGKRSGGADPDASTPQAAQRKS